MEKQEPAAEGESGNCLRPRWTECACGPMAWRMRSGTAPMASPPGDRVGGRVTVAGVNLGTAGVLTPALSSPFFSIPPGFSCNIYLNGNAAVVEYSGTIC